ncbi:class I SAM-dependent methyltransferase, partial [bacterium]|nr:class I SAM-dependent methyltransferase [bacterium]
KKKINAVEHFKTALNLSNLNPICDRVENINTKYDFVVSRAVTSLDKLLELSIPKVKKGGYLIAYKSKKYLEELQQAQSVIKKYSLSTPQIISYKLPLEEVYERYLVIFKL